MYTVSNAHYIPKKVSMQPKQLFHNLCDQLSVMTCTQIQSMPHGIFFSCTSVTEYSSTEVSCSNHDNWRNASILSILGLMFIPLI